MAEETLTCPRCRTELRSSATANLPVRSKLRCRSCHQLFTLADGRKVWSKPVFPPSDFRPPFSEEYYDDVRSRTSLSISVLKVMVLLGSAVVCATCLVLIVSSLSTARSDAEQFVASSGLDDAESAAQRAIESGLKVRKPVGINIAVEKNSDSSITARGTVDVQDAAGKYRTEGVKVSLVHDERAVRMATLALGGEVFDLDREALAEVNAATPFANERILERDTVRAQSAPSGYVEPNGSLSEQSDLSEPSAEQDFALSGADPVDRVTVSDVHQRITPLGSTEIVLTAHNARYVPVSQLDIDVTFTHQRQKVAAGRVSMRVDPPLAPQSRRELHYRIPYGSKLRSQLPSECVGSGVVITAD